MPCSPYNQTAGNRLIVTSTTRPTGYDLVIGREIYELDTGRTLVYDGTGWVILDEPIQTNTSASFSGITTGTPTYANSYRRTGGMCWFQNKVTFGSAPGAIANLAAILPVATSGLVTGALGVVYADVGVQSYVGFSEQAAAAATSVAIYASDASTAIVRLAFVSTTVPFTFGNTDTISVSGWFPMNTRYL